MEYLTFNMPDVNFVFVGRTRNKNSIRRLLKYPNIFFLGEKHYSVIPSYLSYFDVCLLPHKVDDFTNNMNPQKLYEYLSIGKPVVSTPVVGVEVFSKVMRIAGSREEFLLGVRESLNDDPRLINLRIETVKPHSWSNRAESMLQQIVKAISEKERS
jgi:glycosyltransferase involved in cell wall biosynthesis